MDEPMSLRPPMPALPAQVAEMIEKARNVGGGSGPPSDVGQPPPPPVLAQPVPPPKPQRSVLSIDGTPACIVEDMHLRGTLEQALHLYPEAKQINVLPDRRVAPPLVFKRWAPGDPDPGAEEARQRAERVALAKTQTLDETTEAAHSALINLANFERMIGEAARSSFNTHPMYRIFKSQLVSAVRKGGRMVNESGDPLDDDGSDPAVGAAA